jgi:hypothetical protein
MRKILVSTEKPFASAAIKKINKVFEKAGKDTKLFCWKVIQIVKNL